MKNVDLTAIQTRGLTRSFRNLTAVKNLNINVPCGSIYGFLGPNGAGKTTTIRMLLDLIKPDAGTVRLFGASLAGKRASVLRRVGSLIEMPSLYPHLTGRENLEVTRRLLDVSRRRIEEVLEVVRLEKDAARLVREYSLGMRQRLGLALALLGEPELLILDEPTNGLDPAGIREMRALLRRLPEIYGVTIFLSSHLLSEIEQTATHIGIVNRGELLFEGALGDLQARRREHLTVKVCDAEKASQILESFGWRVSTGEDSKLNVKIKTPEEAAQINKTLVRSNLDVFHLDMERLSLEDIFLNLTNESAEESGK